MSAQYRPYRDDESVDGNEAAAWTDAEIGSIQIYEKTTEELPFSLSNKKRLCIQISILLGGFFIGLIAGSLLHLNSSFGLHPEIDIDPEFYFEHHYPEEFSIKDRILDDVKIDSISETLMRFQNTDRRPGTDGQEKFAKYVEDSFINYGLDNVTKMIHSFSKGIPHKPTEVKLISKEQKIIYSNLENEIYPFNDMRPYIPASPASDANFSTDQLLYVNSGSKDDFLSLEKWGYGVNDTKGKIFVMRQSSQQFIEDVSRAQDKGAEAILIFPDPNFYGNGSSFPKSMQLPDDIGISWPTMWSNHGDILNGLLHNLETKLGLDEESKIQIPVIPISFKTAAKILQGLAGHQAPSEWNCFDFTLYLGPGYRDSSEDNRTRVDINLDIHEVDIVSSTITGVIVGSVEPDRYVILGSRRDSLNRGVLDSLSGSAIMLELARVYGGLVKQGLWRPRRTIVFNSFGSESFNLHGSTSWFEEHQRILETRVVAYINCDLVVLGNSSITVASSPLLYQTLFNATKQVQDPNHSLEGTKTIYDSWKMHDSSQTVDSDGWSKIYAEIESEIQKYETPKSRLIKGAEDEYLENAFRPGSILHDFRTSIKKVERPRIRRLDMHSMYTPYLLYSGIPAVDIHYSGFLKHHTSENLTAVLPILGSRYDNMTAVVNIDPDLKHHKALCQVMGEMLRSVSDSPFLPFNLLDYVVRIKERFEKFSEWIHSIQINNSTIDLNILKDSINIFTHAAIKFHHKQDILNYKDAMKIRKINDQLMILERTLLDPNGIPSHFDRKHVILDANNDGSFPGLVDLISSLEVDLKNQTSAEYSIVMQLIKTHYKSLVITIKNAAKVIDDVYLF